jgi:hypothetical protein
MALTRKDNVTPEENLLRLIEKPAIIGETKLQAEDADASPDEGKRNRLNLRRLLLFATGLFLRSGKNLSLKSVNKLALMVITLLLGYAVWNFVTAESAVVPQPETKKIPGDNTIHQSDITLYYRMVDERDIFKDMYKTPGIETPITPVTQTTTTTQPPVVPEVKTPITEVLKSLKLIGIIWEPKPSMVLIDDAVRKDVYCLEQGESFITKVEESGNTKDALIEIKEISKDKVIIKYENEEGFLTLTE